VAGWDDVVLIVWMYAAAAADADADDADDVQRMYLVMELCDGGELSRLLQEHGPFSEDETKVVVEQLARAISYLHRNGTFCFAISFLVISHFLLL